MFWSRCSPRKRNLSWVFREKRSSPLGRDYAYSFPLADRSVPTDSAEFHLFIRQLTGEVAAGRNVAAHCRGSIGRATIVTACVLIAQSWTPDRALAAIEAARECTVPDTADQRSWIKQFSNS